MFWEWNCDAPAYQIAVLSGHALLGAYFSACCVSFLNYHKNRHKSFFLNIPLQALYLYRLNDTRRVPFIPEVVTDKLNEWNTQQFLVHLSLGFFILYYKLCIDQHIRYHGFVYSVQVFEIVVAYAIFKRSAFCIFDPSQMQSSFHMLYHIFRTILYFAFFAITFILYMCW